MHRIRGDVELLVTVEQGVVPRSHGARDLVHRRGEALQDIDGDRPEGGIGVGVGRAHVRLSGLGRLTLLARRGPEQAHGRMREEGEGLKHLVVVDVAQHSPSAEAVELEDVQPPLLGPLEGRRSEVEAHPHQLDRVSGGL